MAQSTDPRHFFQTSSSIAETDRKAAKSKNKLGAPIRLQSKLLAVAKDPRTENALFVAESAGLVRRVLLETAETTNIYNGPTAPVTCLAISPTTIVAGSWDKTIYGWQLDSSKRVQGPFIRLSGHNDFVKSLLYLPVSQSKEKFSNGLREFIVSGGADNSIILWSLPDGSKLHVLKPESRGILSLVGLPRYHVEDAIQILAGTSDRQILTIDVKLGTEPKLELKGNLGYHETSVNALRVAGEESIQDLWTASSDKTAKRIVPLSELTIFDEGDHCEDTILEHPDFVRDVVVDAEGGMVVTACRDEDVRVWDIASGKLVHTFEGHYEEVTGLLWLERKKTVVSVSIDGTIRQWSLKPEDLKKAKEAAERLSEEGPAEVEEKKESLLTEEEDRELAELMDDD